ILDRGKREEPDILGADLVLLFISDIRENPRSVIHHACCTSKKVCEHGIHIAGRDTLAEVAVGAEFSELLCRNEIVRVSEGSVTRFHSIERVAAVSSREIGTDVSGDCPALRTRSGERL